MTVASYRRKATGLEHRPSGQPLLDRSGRSAHNYGSEGWQAAKDRLIVSGSDGANRSTNRGKTRKMARTASAATYGASVTIGHRTSSGGSGARPPLQHSDCKPAYFRYIRSHYRPGWNSCRFLLRPSIGKCKGWRRRFQWRYPTFTSSTLMTAKAPSGF